MEEIYTKLLILGSGPAGCTAATYAARSNLNPILVHGNQPGGQLTITTDVENYPGFARPVQGPWLMEQMIEQVKNVGCEVINDNINKINLNMRPFVFEGDKEKKYVAESLIISTGASAKWLGIESEEKFRGFGISACATCDAFFFKEKIVAVVGGGNTAIEEALFLTKFAKKVLLIHRREKLRAEKILQKRAFENDKIEFIWNSKIVEVIGLENPKKVTGLKIQNSNTKIKSEIKIDGLFVAIGHKPNTILFKDFLDLDQEGYIKTNKQVFTNIEGVYAAGDVHDKTYRQAVTAAGFGCMAAIEAEQYLELKI
tara:strand:+ start:336 stop:1274 length:939 start_codon:yes stop_codon:yes gene_type:complete